MSSPSIAGQIQPLPTQLYPLGEAVTAMRELAAARHIGKVVLQIPASLPQPVRASEGGRWVITGGTGALGAIAGKFGDKRSKMEAHFDELLQAKLMQTAYIKSHPKDFVGVPTREWQILHAS